IDMLFVDCGCAGRQGIELMNGMNAGGILALPEQLAVDRRVAVDEARAGFGVGTDEKDLFAPDDWRGIARAGELDFPKFFAGFPNGRNSGRFAFAGAVGTAEASPLVGMYQCGTKSQNPRGQDDRSNGHRIASLLMQT